MPFQVRVVSRTWKSGTPTDRSVPWESGEESHLFHPMHKSGIFRHTLFYFTVEIRFFTYRFLRRIISDAQLLKYQYNKRNVGPLLYSTLCFFIDRSNIISLCSYGSNGIVLNWIEHKASNKIMPVATIFQGATGLLSCGCFQAIFIHL